LNPQLLNYFLAAFHLTHQEGVLGRMLTSNWNLHRGQVTNIAFLIAPGIPHFPPHSGQITTDLSSY
jgi:hypothetical protein